MAVNEVPVMRATFPENFAAFWAIFHLKQKTKMWMFCLDFLRTWLDSCYFCITFNKTIVIINALFGLNSSIFLFCLVDLVILLQPDCHGKAVLKFSQSLTPSLWHLIRDVFFLVCAIKRFFLDQEEWLNLSPAHWALWCPDPAEASVTQWCMSTWQCHPGCRISSAYYARFFVGVDWN